MIGLCTDSGSQLSAELQERYDIVVVPITVEVDGHEYLEGVDLDADQFYAAFADGHRPTVSTSQPSPGQFALAYEELVDRGCTEVLSVHLGAAVSGTLNSARLAAHKASIPIRLIDTGLASFGVSCCTWAAAAVIAQGGSLDEAAQAAERVAPLVGNVFTVSSLDLVRAGGRSGAALMDAGEVPGTPVLTLRNGKVESVGVAHSIDDAVQAMAAEALAWGPCINVAVGLADRAGAAVSEALADRLRGEPSVNEIVTYRVGPSVGAHTGPGTAGAFYFPVLAGGSDRFSA